MSKNLGLPLQRPPVTEIPQLVKDACAYIEDQAINVAGIFRKPCLNLTEIMTIKRAFLDGNPPDLNECMSVHTVSGLLLAYLRDLEIPLVTCQALHECLVRYNIGPTKRMDLRFLTRVVKQSTGPRYDLLRHIVLFFHRVSLNCAANDATAPALAIVIGPAICRPEESKYMSIKHMTHLPAIRDFVTALISNAPTVFNAITPETPIEKTPSFAADAVLVDQLLQSTVSTCLFNFKTKAATTTSDPSSAAAAADKLQSLDLNQPLSSGLKRSKHAEKKSRKKTPGKKKRRGASRTPEENPSAEAGESREDLFSLSTAQLRKLKKTIKQQLVKYDLEWKANHGRMPTGKEKEPIRHLYTKYKNVKYFLQHHSNDLSLTRKDSEEEEEEATNPSLSETINADLGQTMNNALSATTLLSGGDLQTLLDEKRALQVKLRSFEEKFKKKHGRSVKFHKDIASVKEEYSRYKTLKKVLRKNGFVSTKSKQGRSAN